MKKNAGSISRTRTFRITTESLLPSRLKEARLESGLLQKSLGIEAGLDEFSASPRINQYEKGTHAPAFDMIRRIADVLDLPVAFFYAEDSELAEMIKGCGSDRPPSSSVVSTHLRSGCASSTIASGIMIK